MGVRADVVDGEIILEFLQQDSTSEEEDPQHTANLDLAWGGRERGRMLGGGLLRGVRATFSRVNV